MYHAYHVFHFFYGAVVFCFNVQFLSGIREW